MTVPTGHTFATCYIDLCKQQRLRPLPIICVTLPHNLDFTTDRVKMDDWGPILNSLSLDRSLKSVSVRSRYQYRRQPLGNINSVAGKTQRLGKQPPVILTRYLLEWLCHSVAQCVRNSSALTCLQLEGVRLPADCLAALCVGLSGTETLQHLSLKRCYIGDNCCAMVCKTVADIHSIKSLNLSQCDLSSNCGEALAAALSRQKLLLYHNTWKDSLRYREPNFQTMGGLRRLTLNGNPHLGNLAVVQIIDAIQDSLWLKAFDLQNCGLTDTIGDKIIELLDCNKTLEVIDVRLNSNLSDNIVQDIVKRLEINNVGCKLEYKFLNLIQKDRGAAPTSDESTNKKQNNCNDINCVARPKSNCAIVRNTKSLVHGSISLPGKKSSGIIGKRPKIQLSLPSSSTFKQKLNKNKISAGEKPPIQSRKASLHLDLQSRISPVVDDSWQIRQTQVNKSQNNSTTDAMSQTDRIIEVPITTTRRTTKFDNILQQLSEVQIEKEELQSIKRELKEERLRREADETKLQTMQRNLTDLESILRTKELESRGCLLVSQQSLDEISVTFEQLTEVLDDLSTKEQKIKWRNEAETPCADIRQRIELLIRKTKSEKLYREFTESQSTKKFSKSENEMTNLSPINIERNIGDHPNSLLPISASSVINSNIEVDCDKPKPIFSPCERARAIFAQIINSDIILNLDSHVS